MTCIKLLKLHNHDVSSQPSLSNNAFLHFGSHCFWPLLATNSLRTPNFQQPSRVSSNFSMLHITFPIILFTYHNFLFGSDSAILSSREGGVMCAHSTLDAFLYEKLSRFVQAFITNAWRLSPIHATALVVLGSICLCSKSCARLCKDRLATQKTKARQLLSKTLRAQTFCIRWRTPRAALYLATR